MFVLPLPGRFRHRAAYGLNGGIDEEKCCLVNRICGSINHGQQGGFENTHGMKRERSVAKLGWVGLSDGWIGVK